MTFKLTCRSKLMAGKTCLVTGATGGIGRATALELAHMGADMVIVGRNQAKCAATAIDMREESGNASVEYLVADLSSQEEVHRLADEFKQCHQTLDVLVNNAGAIHLSRKNSADGIEMTFALNHLSYFLLTNLLLDVLSAPVQSHRILHLALDPHHLQQRMIQQFLRIPVHQRVHVPKSVRLHQRAVIVGQLKLRVILQEQVAHVGKVHQPVECLRLETVFPA